MSLRCFSRVFRAVNSLSPRVCHTAAARSFHLEVRAAQKLLQRSFPQQLTCYRALSSQKPPGPGKSGEQSGSNEKQSKKNNEDEEQKNSLLFKAAVWTLSAYLVITLMSLMFPSSQQENLRFVSWTEFFHNMLAKGEVEEVIVRPELDFVTIVLHEGAVIKGRRAEHRTYHMNIVGVEHFEQRLRQAEQQLGVSPGSVALVYDRQTHDSAWVLLVALVGIAIITLLMTKKGKSAIPGKDFFSQMTRAKFTVVDHAVESTKPTVRFSDVAGLHEAKVEIAEFIDYLQDSSKYKKLGAKVPKGVLLLGPPGCGKTMLAKAVAAEAKVPFLAMAGSEFIEMIGGLGAARVRDLFKEARKRAPCIIYIDEIDAIGRKRSGSQAGGAAAEEEQTLNQLLVEMDGMATKEGVIMLGSTNRSEVLDMALLRPGRFDRHIMIDLPNLAERIEIYEKHLASVVLDRAPSQYSKRLAELTPGFSGADIANVCNEAALHAARSKQRSIKSADIEYAVERVVGGTERKTHAMSKEERRRVAIHECGHATVGWLMEHTDALLKISIVPRTKGALGMARYVPSEQKLYTTEQLFERICMALGGRAAEVVIYGQPSTGAQDDLKKVTDIAKAIVENYGMDNTVGPLSYPERRPYSKRLANTMDYRAQQLVQQAYNTTVDLIRKNQDKLKELADELVRKEVMDFKDVEAILGPRPYGNKPPFSEDLLK